VLAAASLLRHNVELRSRQGPSLGPEDTAAPWVDGTCVHRSDWCSLRPTLIKIVLSQPLGAWTASSSLAQRREAYPQDAGGCPKRFTLSDPECSGLGGERDKATAGVLRSLGPCRWRMPALPNKSLTIYLR